MLYRLYSVKTIFYNSDLHIVIQINAIVRNKSTLHRRKTTVPALTAFRGQRLLRHVPHEAVRGRNSTGISKRTKPAYSIASTGGTPATAFRAALTVGQERMWIKIRLKKKLLSNGVWAINNKWRSPLTYLIKKLELRSTHLRS